MKTLKYLLSHSNVKEAAHRLHRIGLDECADEVYYHCMGEKEIYDSMRTDRKILAYAMLSLIESDTEEFDEYMS